jgi:hypothetical protein
VADDIVNRLRNYDFLRDGDYPEVWMAEAADEIEHLRAEVSRVNMQSKYFESEFMACWKDLKAVRNG